MSEYKAKGDKIFGDLRLAKNDVFAIRDFLLGCYLKFEKENIIILLNQSIEKIKETMASFYKTI